MAIVLGCLCGTLTVSCSDTASTDAKTETTGGMGSTDGSPSIGGANGTATGGSLSIGGTGGSTTIAGSSTAGGFTSSSPSSATKQIARVTIPQSIFTPVELETIVNDLVAELNKANPTSMRLDVILKAASTYFQPVVVGASRAMSELQALGGTAALQNSSSDAAILEQSAMMTDDIAQGTKGFGITPWAGDPGTSINDAVAAGVPVVTIDSDLADSNRDLHISTVNSQAGITAGNTLKGYLPSSGGTVVILGHGETNWPDGYNRTMGAKTVLDAAGYATTVVTSNWADNHVTDLATLGNLLATSTPPVVGMLGMFSNAWVCAAAAEAAGKAGSDVAIVAFDFDPQTVAYMTSGLIKATHAQRQYYMGYITPCVLYGMNVLGKDKTKSILGAQMLDNYQFNTGLDVVGAEQLDDYATYLDSLGIGASN